MVGAYSIGTSKKCVDPKEKQQKNIPGVGSYSPDVELKVQHRQAPVFTLPKAKRVNAKRSNEKSPGAGTYEDQSPRIKRNYPSITIGLKTESNFERLLRKEKVKQPGPGKYDPFRSSLSNISYTICGKNDKDELKKNMTSLMRSSIDSFNLKPGPADYHNMRTSFDSTSIDATRAINTSQSSITSIPRQNTYRLPNGKLDPLKKDKLSRPGPGTYRIHDIGVESFTHRSSYKTIIGTSKRSGIIGNSFNPGPQDYNFISFMGQNKTLAVMKSAHQKRDNSSGHNPKTPGVGSYDVAKSTDFTKMKVPAMRIGTSVRQSIDRANLKDFPGPANYNVDDQTIKWVKNHSPRPFIGSSQRYELNRTMNWPGPANYMNKNNMGDIKEQYQKVAIRGRGSPRTNANNSPGPIYNTIEAIRATKNKSPAFKIGTSPKIDRNQKSSRNNPGPGSYNLQFELTRQSLNLRSNFPRAKKHDLVQNSGGPGPGYYKLPAKFNELQDYQIPKSQRITEV